MTILPTGDLARHITVRNQMTNVKSDMLRHSQELASGRVTDPGLRIKGDFTSLAGIERSLKHMEGYKSATMEASLLAGGMQESLAVVHDLGGEVGRLMLSISGVAHDTAINTASLAAKDSFEMVISSLNMQVAGRTFLAGDATDGRAVMASDDILTNLHVAVAGAANPTEIHAAVRDWFEGGNAYLGSDSAMAPIQLSEVEVVKLDVTAQHPVVTEMLIGLALGALMGDGLLQGDNVQRSELARISGEGLISAQDGMAYLRAEIGLAQSRIDQVAARIGAEQTTLAAARDQLIGVDPIDAATHLEATQTQLETLYAVTARLSRLSLVDFLR